MNSRGQDLRKRHNWILVWSIAIAGLFHVALFLLWPTMEVEPLPSTESSIEATAPIAGHAIMVDVHFGPPKIFQRDGSVSVEPPERVLETSRIMSLPTGCGNLIQEDRMPARGEVRLQVVASGHTQVEGIEASTGDECADQVVLTLANDLLYRWIPSERFPAPVELIQPVTLTRATS